MAAGDVSTGVSMLHSIVEQADGSQGILVKPTDSFDTNVHAYAQVVVGVAAKSLADLSLPVPAWAILAFIAPENGEIRYRADGQNPTLTAGMVVSASGVWPIQGRAALAALRMIAAADTKVSIEFRG